MSKILNLNGTRFVIPEVMPIKDLQALAGFLVTLKVVHHSYGWGSDESKYYADHGASVTMEDLDLTTKEEAQAFEKASRAAYEARKAAETA